MALAKVCPTYNRPKKTFQKTNYLKSKIREFDIPAYKYPISTTIGKFEVFEHLLDSGKNEKKKLILISFLLDNTNKLKCNSMLDIKF